MPVIDVAGIESSHDTAAAIDQACREVGFFCVTGHGVAPAALDELDAAARAFFALAEREKDAVAMARAGLAWRGWFPLGGELTAGRPDTKEGLYFGREGTERAEDTGCTHGYGGAPPRRPLHGPNQWPARPVELRPAVEQWMRSMETLGQSLLRAMARGLGLAPSHFHDHLTADPVVLFRIFRYPPLRRDCEWSVAEHTDYGLLTLLAHDGTPGLQIRIGDEWVAAPADRELIVCNLGDMLDRMTGGRYRSTAHRVRNTSGHDRLSFPFFLDPGWDAHVEPLPLDGAPPADDAARRWDATSLRTLDGTYGDYLWAKVAKVFPDLSTRRG